MYVEEKSSLLSHIRTLAGHNYGRMWFQTQVRDSHGIAELSLPTFYHVSMLMFASMLENDYL